MIQRFLVEGKPGATIRSGAPYSTWFNGGLRTTASFHNIIGLLTETIGSPTPIEIPLVAAKQLPKGDYLAPIAPQTWHLRQSVEYSLTANRAVLDYASRHREQLLYNVWLMGHNAIERGNRDSWTVTPRVVAAAAPPEAGAADGSPGAAAKTARRGGGRAGVPGKSARSARQAADDFQRLFRDPARRDPRGYIVPADQADFLTATKFINTLLGTGVQVLRATAEFDVAGKHYPSGSYVVKTAQAYRAHVLDMFEPQDHPNDFAYDGGPPIRPYDSAGYTPAFQMAVAFDRVLEGFDGPFEAITEPVVQPPAARVASVENAVGFFLRDRQNDAFRAVNRLQHAGEEVYRLQEQCAGSTCPAGTFYIPRRASTLALLETIAGELGTPFQGTSTPPLHGLVALRTPRIGLWDRYGGSMPSGWTRWILEQFEFPFRVVYAPELDKGNLREAFDVLILVDGAYGARGGADPSRSGTGDQTDESRADTATERPAGENDPYRNQRGNLTASTTVPQLKRFLEGGGTVLAIGSSTRLGRELGLPVSDHLAEVDEQDRERPVPPEKFYVPPSVLRIRVDPTNPLAWGLGEELDVMFASSPAFRLTGDDPVKNLWKVGWFEGKSPLRSGWAWGQERLDGGIAIIDATVGKGRLALFGPQVLFRGQSHGTFKLVFNGIVQSVVEEPAGAVLEQR
jgi:hypothetical protein